MYLSKNKLSRNKTKSQAKYLVIALDWNNQSISREAKRRTSLNLFSRA